MLNKSTWLGISLIAFLGIANAQSWENCFLSYKRGSPELRACDARNADRSAEERRHKESLDAQKAQNQEIKDVIESQRRRAEMDASIAASKREKDQSAQKERCPGTGCAAPSKESTGTTSTVAECAGWLAAFVVADADYSIRNEKGLWDSLDAMTKVESNARANKHPMASQTKELAVKGGGNAFVSARDQKVVPEIKILIPRVASDFPEKSASEKKFIVLQLIEEKAAATCADAGEKEVHFVSLAKSSDSSMSGGTSSTSSISQQTRQKDKNQVKNTFGDDCRAYAKALHAVAEARDNRDEPPWERLLERHPILQEIKKMDGRGYTYAQLINLRVINKTTSPNALMKDSYDSCLDSTGMCMLYNRGCGPNDGK